MENVEGKNRSNWIHKYFDKYKVDGIKCGESHSYIHTECGKNFLFGQNNDNECITFNEEGNISIPHRFDDIIQQKCNIHGILDVFPGYYNTKILCLAKS